MTCRCCCQPPRQRLAIHPGEHWAMRNGRTAIIRAVDDRWAWPVVGTVLMAMGRPAGSTWRADGAFLPDGRAHPFDLVRRIGRG